MVFAKNIRLQEFLALCLWCGEEKALFLVLELHVKYLTIILHTLAAWRTSCHGNSAQDRSMGRRRQNYGDYQKTGKKIG